MYKQGSARITGLTGGGRKQSVLGAWWGIACLLAMAFWACSATAADGNTLKSVDFTALPGNQVKITLQLSAPPTKPNSFEIQQPARIAFDFANTVNALKDKSVDIGVGLVEGLATAEADGRTRVVIKLAKMVPYTTNISGNQFEITLATPGSNMAGSQQRGGSGAPASAAMASGNNAITDVDFHRQEDGTGRLTVSLQDPSVPLDIHKEGDTIVADLMNTTVPARLQRRLDVTDFATPVSQVDVRQMGSGVRIAVKAHGDYDHLAYQAGDQLAIEVKPLTKQEQEQKAAQKPKYTGEKLSLSFQDIEVRSVLQLIADFTGLNMVVSDSVQGNITLRLQNVPWDQALDIILKTKGLAKRRNGNVILVAPAQEIAAREQNELKAQQQVEKLAPLQTEYLQVNYAKATDIAKLLKSDKNSLLSTRGNVTVDDRTNTLIVQDTAENLTDIRGLLAKLDIPVRQVLIESRIVIATDDFSRDLGVRFGYSGNNRIQNTDNVGGVVGGTQPGYVNYGGISGIEVPAGSGNEGLMVDLPAINSAASVGMAIGKIGTWLLQLELSAMETENQGQVISSPRVITANQKEAKIEQGVEIPYQEASSSGATSVSFKKAVLSLQVTPQITPDDRIIMDLTVNKDSVGQVFSGIPSVDTRQIATQVLVDNGETVVLGGIYERNKNHVINRVPFFGDLPIVGALFRNKQNTNNNSELLIFVTPKILKESLTAK